ncbi:heparan-alpha-glucosaminide N-acetyltransferase domain-containing protein [Pseudonocardia xishanensis]|uniref:Heparan-alpha-glucosaminide N-acetyltransferase domain-containing protein n=1 Tax=Pseudonocardia xishanensis TaxID=630995 RepID=A0ABP8RGP9_9PSEU
MNPAAPRIEGIDAARGLALLGMMATHVLPLHTATGETVVGAVAAGRASGLFAVLLGVGIALGSRVTDGRAHLAAAGGLLVRAVLTGLVGLVLVGLGPPVAVIPTYYAVLIAVAIPLLRAPAWLLAGGAVLACAGTPALSALLRTGSPAGPGAQIGFAELADPGAALRTLLLTGYYPVLTWTTYLLAGMAVGRLDLRSSRTGWGLLGGGAALAATAAVLSSVLLAAGGLEAVGGPRELLVQRYGTVPTDTWWWLAVELPHSGTPFDLAQTTGSALAVLGAALLVARAVPWAVVPFAAIGAVPLTLYALHVASLAVLGGEGLSTYVWHVGWCLAIGLVVRSLGARGPAEAVVSGASRSVRTMMLR